METWSRLKVTRGVGGGGQWWKEGEGSRPGTRMDDPQTWTTGEEGGMGGGGQRGKNWENCNTVTIKMIS